MPAPQSVKYLEEAPFQPEAVGGVKSVPAQSAELQAASSPAHQAPSPGLLEESRASG